MKTFFVSGTDTDCGKTAVGCAIARELRAAGERVHVLKPIETGCEERDGERIAADARALAEAAGDTRAPEVICPLRYALPAAPEIAARVEGEKIAFETLERAVHDAQQGADWLLVEGAGGLRVPIAPGLDMRELARRLDVPVILVARATLGTINHTELSLESARAAGLEVVGVVVSHTTPDLSAADQQNLDLMLEALSAPLLGHLRHGAERVDPPILPQLR